MNVLLTCAGRRSYMVDYFKKAVAPDGQVLVANSTEVSTAMAVADKSFVVPGIYEPHYIDRILQLCVDNDVKLVVSLFDLELPILSENREAFDGHGIKIAISTPEVINLCYDKWETSCFINNQTEFSSPLSTLKLEEAVQWVKTGKVSFPLYLKPRFGTGSIAIQRAETLEELFLLFKKVKRDQKKSYLKHKSQGHQSKDIIIQENLVGAEYGLDIINDLEANYQTTFVKRKFAMRSGETDGAITEHEPILEKAGERIARTLRHIGILDVDVFFDGKEVYVLELNPRFGGGYPFSHLAGADIPGAYIAWTSETVPPKECFSIQYNYRGLKSICPIELP